MTRPQHKEKRTFPPTSLSLGNGTANCLHAWEKHDSFSALNDISPLPSFFHYLEEMPFFLPLSL